MLDLGTILFDIEESDPKARIQSFIDLWKNPEYEGFDRDLMRVLKVKSVTQTTKPVLSATTMFSLFVTPNLQNSRSTMHGGALALLIDMTTTAAAAPLSRAGFWHFGGVTRTLNLTCLKPVIGGTTVWIECEVKGIGKRMATISCTVRDEKGVILATGEHGKAALPNEVDISKL